MAIPSKDYCDVCGHEDVVHDLTGRCTSRGTGNFTCDCRTYCAEFVPDLHKSPTTGVEQNGLKCDNCGREAFEHQSVKDDLAKQLLKVGMVSTKDGGRPYKVQVDGLKACCQWTLHHYMETIEDPQTLVVGSFVECPLCEHMGRMVVIEDGFSLGPTWKWQYGKKASPSVVNKGFPE